MHMLLPLLLITLPPSAAVLIGTSLALGIFFVGGIHVVAYALQNPQLTAIAKEELAALLFSVFIIVFWLGSDAVLNGVSGGLLASTLPPGTSLPATSLADGWRSSHLNIAIASLDIIYGKLKSAYIDLYLYEALIGFLSTISFPLGSPLPAINIISISVAPFTGLALLSNAHTLVVESIGYLVPIIWAKQFIVIFARDTVPLLLLPLGIVLRAFPFFRMTGSSIIALSFALYFAFPFAVILSNYLIFDVFQTADFAYTPVSSSYFGTDKSQEQWNRELGDVHSGGETQEFLETFQSQDIAETQSTQGECSGNFIVKLLCSIKNIIVGAVEVAVDFFKTVWNIWKFMVGLTGDFFWTLFNNPVLPESASAGLYYFIIMEVANVSPIIILVLVTTLIEIIITITMYRNVSLLIGGEAELIGITKVV